MKHPLIGASARLRPPCGLPFVAEGSGPGISDAASHASPSAPAWCDVSKGPESVGTYGGATSRCSSFVASRGFRKA